VALHDLQAPPAADPPSRVGGYVLVRRIGKGGMGEVWLGRHEISGALGAIKRVTGAHADVAREARAVRRLAHPHVVPVFAVGPDYLVTAFIDGGSLARRLQTPMEPAEALRIVRHVADALAHAHARGVVHRDVKPSNILLDGRGTPYLTDFGVATIAGEDDGQSAGTPQFMAPEQRRGGRVGPAADQYALGRTLLEMLAGGAVPLEPTAALAELPAQLPAALREAIARATAPDPAQRFPSMTALRDALTAIEMGALAAPRRRAAPLRDPSAFAWVAGAHTARLVGPDLVRADYRLRDLAPHLPAGAVDELLGRAGLVDLGFAAWCATPRLGTITDPAALAAAGEVVVLLHGWGHTREVWSLIARTVCRDNARAVVLAADLHGFGESRFAGTPRPDQASVEALMRTIDGWRRLLGLGAIPTALVGHSMAGLGVLHVGDAASGVHVTRIAVNPILPAHPQIARQLRWQARLAATLGRIGALRRLYVALARRKAIRDGMTVDNAAQVAAATLGLTGGQLAALARALARPPAPIGRQNRLALVLCRDDPWLAGELAHAIAAARVEPANLHHLPDGGHYPHQEIRGNPESSARNAADLVRIIESMLVTAGESDAAGSSPLGFESTAHARSRFHEATASLGEARAGGTTKDTAG
jgi:predicted Ser/Thr protein kinase